MHFYPHHIGDFQRDTASLSDSDTMAYLRLIWMYYDTEKPLPADAKLLAFKIGADPDSVQMILDSFFIKEQDIYRHKRCDKVLNEIYDKSEKARLAALARWSNHAGAMQTHSERNADASKNNANATKIDATHNPIPINKEYIDRFDVFWKKYPRKVAKPHALKAWMKIKPDDALTQQMIIAIDKQDLCNRDIQFVPHPATWLNRGQWEDEVASKQDQITMGWK